MVYDAGWNSVVLFGGLTDSLGNASDQTWAWDGELLRWSNATPAVSPSARYGHAMAYDAARGVVVLFGGRTSPNTPDSELNDTWIYDGGTWIQLFPAGDVPQRRSGHVMIYDTLRQETVLFGGRIGDTFLDDTWVWDGMSWTQLTPATSPSPREYAAMAYNEDCMKAVLFGGRADTPLGDTWTWNGTDWVDITGSYWGLPPTYGSAMAYDSQRGGILLHGGYVDVDIMTDAMWFAPGCAPDPWRPDVGWELGERVHAAMAFDGASGYTLLFGGLEPGGTRRNDSWINKIWCVPAASTWGLVCLGLLLLTAGSIVMRRSRTAAVRL